MKCTYACNSAEHEVSRRQFLAGSASAALGAMGFSGMVTPAAAKQLEKSQKRVLLIWLAGGVSQLETWDPKPGTPTGGPFQAIPTSVPGVHISELLPHTAKQMHRMALIRGINTRENNHAKGAIIMHTGRPEDPRTNYPHLGSAMAKLLGPEDSPLPGYIHVTPRGAAGFNKKDAGFLGPKYASITLADGKPPENLLRPKELSVQSDLKRNQLREKLNRRFGQRRRTADTEIYTQSYEQALQLMARHRIFDNTHESPKYLDLYGRHDFGQHCLLARRMLEAGVTFVKVTHSNYDTHHENFNFHIEQMGEFDKTFATLLDDLADRGMLDSTLVIVMSEFGRTPRINQRFGRDHWGTAWSIALAGCGIKGGAVAGKTNAHGTAVVDRQVNGGHLFHTYFRALGLNSKRNYYINQQPIPMADPKAEAIEEILA
ncbi:MAG: hypothetical protein KatS3mg105_3850 [Gemmatales bacterium]|nr:MAG: hypothetical protein KatS3mg105_3850 [Gemmatales bacterium]